MAPSISVHEGESYDPYGPRAEDDHKVKVVTDEATEDMSDDKRAETMSGVDPVALAEAQEAYDKGEGPKVVDQRSEKQRSSDEYRDPTELAPVEGELVDDKEELSSDGTSFSTSTETTDESKKNNATPSPLDVPTAGNVSKQDQAEPSTVQPVTGKKALRKN